jgi:hypothetical protein
VPRSKSGRRFMQRHCSDKRQSGGRRVPLVQADQRARVKVAGRRTPFAPLPATAAGLPFGTNPDPLGSAFPAKRQNIVVG